MCYIKNRDLGLQMRTPCSNLSSIESLVFDATYFSRESLEQYKDYLKEHIEFNAYRMNRIIKCSEEIENQLRRLSNPPQNLIDLINQMRPIHQNQYYALSTLSKEESEMSFENYKKNTSTIRRTSNVEGTFYVRAGTDTETKRIYEVKMFKHGMNEKGSFSCNCPDHRFNAKKKDIVCKHICFVVCTVANILDVAYFQRKQLTEEQFDRVINVTENLPLPE